MQSPRECYDRMAKLFVEAGAAELMDGFMRFLPTETVEETEDEREGVEAAEILLKLWASDAKLRGREKHLGC